LTLAHRMCNKSLFIFVLWLSVGFFTDVTDFASSSVVYAKQEKLVLTIIWDNDLTAEAKLGDDQKEDCIFQGKFILDPNSEVLVTGCDEDAELSVQFYSKIFGRKIFTALKDGTVNAKRDVETMHEYEEYDHDEMLSSDIDSLPDLGDYELDEFDFPSKVELHLNIYLDPVFLKIFGTKATKTAKQIVSHFNKLLQRPSLKTKVEVMTKDDRIYTSDTHLGMKNVRILKSEYNVELPKLLRAPFDVNGAPVVHIYLTKKRGPITGFTSVESVCNALERPRVMVSLNDDGSAITTAVTMAHELGHVLGMYHDFTHRGERSSITCATQGKGEFILNYGNGNPREIWSSCSNDDFQTYYKKVVLRDDKYCLESKGCTTSQFQCNSGKCISNSQRCDGLRRDCQEGEDEAFCEILDDAFIPIDKVQDAPSSPQSNISHLPNKFQVPVNVYLTPRWYALHGSSSMEVALGVISEANQIFKHRSFDTKLEILVEDRIFNSSAKVFNAKRRKEWREDSSYDPDYQEPLDVYHLMLDEIPPNRNIGGISFLGGMCQERIKKRTALIFWRGKELTAANIAKHIAHSLGVERPHLLGKRGRKCVEKSCGTFIMQCGELRESWSSCSNEDFRRYYSEVVQREGRFCLQEVEPRKNIGNK